MPAEGGYTMRAQPRRRKDVKDEPIFLRKTYEMINSCEDRHAAWSTGGDTFVIKDPDLFANEVIPRFFKREIKLTERRIVDRDYSLPVALSLAGHENRSQISVCLL